MEETIDIHFRLPSIINLADEMLEGSIVFFAGKEQIIHDISIFFEETFYTQFKSDQPVIHTRSLGEYHPGEKIVLTPENEVIIDFQLPFTRTTRRHRISFPTWGKFGQRLRRMYKAVDVLSSDFYLICQIEVEGLEEPLESKTQVRVMMK